MFSWGENYFMETTVSFGILTICSDCTLCTMLYAPRLLIYLPNGAGGEILHWAVGSWRAGTMSYSSCLSHRVARSSKAVDKYWMTESLYTWPHSLIPRHKISPPSSTLSYWPAAFFFWAIIASCHGVCGFYYFSPPSSTPEFKFPEGRAWTGLISYIFLP